MAQDPNLVKSVMKMKCPKCHEGNLFSNRNIYQYKGFFDMPNYCPKCSQSFRVETGFYLGAMYVSYALTIALNVAVFVALMTFNSYTLPLFFTVAGISTLVTMPYIIKISRSIWIAMTISYDPNAIADYEKQNNSK
ncbi:MAG: DUF983 domain-containing protein [Vicingaceae bacterium]